VKYTERIRDMAKHIDKDSIVLDLGAGSQELRKFLPSGCKYLPIDGEVNRDLGFQINFDLNKDPTLLRIFQVDCVFCSGILEYIEDLSNLFKIFHRITKKIILSYATIEYYPDIKARREWKWYTDFSRGELIDFIKLSGFKIISEDFSEKFKQIIFVLGEL